MSGIELKQVEGGSPILLPLGETIVGRGPFLGVTDKRVSRSHGILDVSSGKLRLKPIHVNPCFFKSEGSESLQPLPKDQWKDLQHGDQFALLPNTFVFEVIISDTFRKTTTASAGTYVDETVKVQEDVTSPVKQDEDSKSTKDLPAKCPIKEDKKPEDTGDDTRNNTENLSKTNGAAENQEERKKPPSPAPSQETPSQEAKTAQVGDKEVALPLERKRKLPEWMERLPPVDAAGPEDSPDTEVTSTPAKRGIGAEEEQVEGVGEVAAEVVAGGGADHPETIVAVKGKMPPPRQRRGAVLWEGAGGGKRVADEEWVMSGEEEDEEEEGDLSDDGEGSDWEEEEKKRKVTPKAARGKAKARGRRRVYTMDSDDSDEEVLPVSRRASKTQRRTRGGSDDSEEDVRKTRAPAKKSGRRPCSYGKNCYRKNVAHFKEFSHPGDSDYNSETDDRDDADDDDDRPECEFGTNCYRKNPQHKKEFKHTLDPDEEEEEERPKRKASQRTGGAGKTAESDDDGLPNTYDYNDSFLAEEDEEASDQSSYGAGKDEDSDWEPDDEEMEELKHLKKEARRFVHSKKLQQPT
ncbi:APLF [Branchiostoma lanceolatum]|uniref:APLF protein n=1 Tax=Branchiostoma lanceolatum TaxID=7740 RepID=A0A8K0ERJ1_BRALA|nr:APLF [Branchiostoma lanceolatum]